jgi:hypothetical protein
LQTSLESPIELEEPFGVMKAILASKNLPLALRQSPWTVTKDMMTQGIDPKTDPAPGS